MLANSENWRVTLKECFAVSSFICAWTSKNSNACKADRYGWLISHASAQNLKDFQYFSKVKSGFRYLVSYSPSTQVSEYLQFKLSTKVELFTLSFPAPSFHLLFFMQIRINVFSLMKITSTVSAEVLHYFEKG